MAAMIEATYRNGGAPEVSLELLKPGCQQAGHVVAVALTATGRR